MAETEATVQTAIREFALAPRDSSDGKLLSELCQQLRTLHSRIQQNRVHNALIGRPASTALTVDWLGGSPVSFEDLKGSVVLLHFWSANCAHCRANLPTVRSWHEKYGKQGLIVLSVAPYGAFADNETAAPNTKGQAIQDERNALSKIVRQYQISHRVAMFQKESEMGREFAISFYPEFVVLDRSGLIRIIRVGASADKLREIEQLVARYTIEPVAQDSSLPR